MFRTATLIALLIVLQVLSTVPYAQVEIPLLNDPAIPKFSLDVATFRSDEPGLASIEVYIKFYNDEIQFRKSGDSFSASIEISVLLFGPNGLYFSGGSWDDNFEVSHYDKTNSLSDFRIQSCKLLAPPGKYTLAAKLTDEETGRSSEIRKDIEVPDYSSNGTNISDIEFSSEILSDVPPGNFVKNGYKVVPIVDREYGDIIPGIWFYFEVYGRDVDKIDLKYEISDKDGGKVLTREFQTYGETSHIDSIDLERFEEGRYTFKVTAIAPDGKFTSRSGEFDVIWLYYNNFKRNYKEALQQLRYIASQSEIKELENAKPEDREDLWRDFWRGKDPSPTTPRNEVMMEYYRRIRYANEHFSSLKPGWRSDMGKVYIIYGPPDEVERHAFELEIKPYEVWYYYSMDRKFTFVDRTGFGDYEFENPLEDLEIMK